MSNLLLFMMMVVMVTSVAGQDAGSSIGRGQDEKEKGSGGLKREKDGRLNEWAINQGVTWVFRKGQCKGWVGQVSPCIF